jgi:hypothetical protein
MIDKTKTTTKPVDEAEQDLKYAYAAFWKCPGPNQANSILGYQQDWIARHAR